MSHKAVAFERGTYGDQGEQKGYAASCETCGAVTFGGFRTKNDAKAALLHSDNKTATC
jgi:hypothetical protein